MPDEVLFDTVNLTISITTCIGCTYLVYNIIGWWWILRKSITKLRSKFLGLVFLGLGLWFWSFSQIRAILFNNADLPLWSLHGRMLIMIGALLVGWSIIKMKFLSRKKPISKT